MIYFEDEMTIVAHLKAEKEKGEEEEKDKEKLVMKNLDKIEKERKRLEKFKSMTQLS
jgi:hypothetical protein